MSNVFDHRLYLRGVDARKVAVKRSREQDGEPICVCANCWCGGNRGCGHDLLGKDCTIDEWETCPCCNLEPKAASDTEYDNHAGQGRLDV